MGSADAVKAKVVGFVLSLVMLIIILNLTPVFIQSTQIQFTTTWPNGSITGWNFTGYAAAETLLGLLPLIVTIIIFVAIVISLFDDLM